MPTKMILFQEHPISSALNIAASSNSLWDDFVLCEQVIKKHQFVVTILDGMNKKVDNIALQINNLEQSGGHRKKSTYSPRNCSTYFPKMI